MGVGTVKGIEIGAMRGTGHVQKLAADDTAISQNLGSAHFFKFFLRGSQERKDLALNPKRVSLVAGKDRQRGPGKRKVDVDPSVNTLRPMKGLSW